MLVLRDCGEAPGDGGQDPTPEALGVTGKGALMGWEIDMGLTSPRLRTWKDVGSELQGSFIIASSSAPLLPAPTLSEC